MLSPCHNCSRAARSLVSGCKAHAPGGLNSEPIVQPTALPSVVLYNFVECLVVCQALQHSAHGDRHSVPAFLGPADAEQQLQKPVTSMCQVPGTNSEAPVTLGNKKSCQSKKQEAIEVWLALDRNNGERCSTTLHSTSPKSPAGGRTLRGDPRGGSEACGQGQTIHVRPFQAATLESWNSVLEALRSYSKWERSEWDFKSSLRVSVDRRQQRWGLWRRVERVCYLSLC